MKPSAKRFMWAGISVATIGAIVWAVWPGPTRVETTVARRGPLVTTVSAEGKTRVRSLYVVAAPVDGELERIVAQAGDAVTPGATLAQIQPLAARPLDPRSRAEAESAASAARAEVARADAMVREAQVRVAHADNDLARSQELAKSGSGPAAAAEHAAHEAERNRRALEAARAAAREARAQRARAEAVLGMGAGAPGPAAAAVVTSPMVGSVLRVLRESAGPVAAGTPLVEIGDIGDLELVAEVLTGDALSVRPGASAIARWGNGQEVTARVRRIEPAAFTKISALGLEEQRVRVLLDLVAPPPPGLGHDYRVDVSIVVWEGKSVLQVPATAVFRDGSGWAVFVLEEGRIRGRRVTIGASDGERTAVERGLAPGEEVVTQPSDAIHDGTRASAVAVAVAREDP